MSEKKFQENWKWLNGNDNLKKGKVQNWKWLNANDNLKKDTIQTKKLRK